MLLALVLSIPQKISAFSPVKREVIKEKMKEKRQDIIENVKEKIKNVRFAARKTGTLSAISGNTLTLAANDGKNYQVNITDKTQLRRRFAGKSELGEFSAGDKLNVIGKWTDESKTAIDAMMIRNTSIQKRWGVFFGKVTQKNSDNFVVETKERGTETVYFSVSTKFVNRKEEAMSYNDVRVGDRVRIKGMWNRTLKKITEVEQVKDFSLPPMPTKSANSSEAK